jgi:hypothetical protein
VAISVVRNPRSDGVIKIRNDAIRSGMSTGSASGAVVGGILGIACGPFAAVCIPLGAAEGATIGDVAGAAVGATHALSDEKAAQLRRRLDHILRTHSLLAELTQNVTDRAQKYWTLNSAQPATILRVELQDLQLTSTRDERVRCEVRVLVYVEPSSRKPAAGRVRPKLYEYVGPFGSLGIWLDEDNDFVDVNLTQASDQIAAQIISDLSTQ